MRTCIEEALFDGSSPCAVVIHDSAMVRELNMVPTQISFSEVSAGWEN